MNTLELTPNKSVELVGQKIQWFAPAYKHNSPYGGISIIDSVDCTNGRPIKSTTLEGDNLDYSFNEWAAGSKLDNPMCFSDGDRYIHFEIIEDEN